VDKSTGSLHLDVWEISPWSCWCGPLVVHVVITCMLVVHTRHRGRRDFVSLTITLPFALPLVSLIILLLFVCLFQFSKTNWTFPHWL
jgi:hypothetical protein